MFPDFVRRGYCTDLRACQPISVAGYAYERTRPNGRNLNLDKFEWIVVASFGRRQTDLVVIVAFVHRFCRERLWQSVPLRRTRCRFDSVEFLRHVTKFRNNNRLLVILSWSNFIDVFFKVSNKGTKFISCRTMEYCAGTYFTESPVQTENLAGCNEQVWTTGVDIYIYKATVKVENAFWNSRMFAFPMHLRIPRRRNTAVHSIRSDHQRRERVKILGQFRNRNG